MPVRRGNRQKYIRWIAVFLVFAVALPFAVVVLSQPGSDETNSTVEPPSQPTEKPSTSNSEDESLEVSPTALPFVIEQAPNNKAPSITLDGPDCIESPGEGAVVSIAISANDIDDTSVVLDLAALVGDESINLTSSINEGPELVVPGIASATFPIPPTEESYLLLISHATDFDGSKSEAALVIPFRCD